MILYYGTLCYIMLYHSMLYYIKSYYIILCYIILYYLVLFHVIAYHITLYYIIQAAIEGGRVAVSERRGSARPEYDILYYIIVCYDMI